MRKIIAIIASAIITTSVFAADCTSMSLELIKKGVLCQIQADKQAKALEAVRANNTQANQQIWHDAAQETLECQFKAIDICEKY